MTRTHPTPDASTPAGRRRFAGRLVAVIGVAVASVLILVGVASAQTNPLQPAAPTSSAPPSPSAPPATAPVPKGSAAPNTWAVSPAGNDPTQPGNRANFSYDLAPGSAVKDAAIVWNYADEKRIFNLYARDAFNTGTGTIDLLTKDQHSKDAGSWVTFSQDQVEVPPRSGIAVPFTVTLPRDVTPGDHDAGVVASLVTGASNDSEKKVVLDHRVGVRMYIRVPGPLEPSLVVDDLQSAFSGVANPLGRGELDVTYRVRNAGNVRLKAKQAMSLTGVFGLASQERQLDDLPELLPGASMTFSQHFVDVPPAIRLTTTVTLTPEAPKAAGKDAPAVEPIVTSVSVWAIPWPLLVFVIALALFFGWRWRARRRRKASRIVPPDQRPGDGGVGDGDAPTGGGPSQLELEPTMSSS